MQPLAGGVPVARGEQRRGRRPAGRAGSGRGRPGRGRPAAPPRSASARGSGRPRRSPRCSPRGVPAAPAARRAPASSSSPCRACGTRRRAARPRLLGARGRPSRTASSGCARCRSRARRSRACRSTPPRNSGRNRGRSAFGMGCAGTGLHGDRPAMPDARCLTSWSIAAAAPREQVDLRRPASRAARRPRGCRRSSARIARCRAGRPARCARDRTATRGRSSRSPPHGSPVRPEPCTDGTRMPANAADPQRVATGRRARARPRRRPPPRTGGRAVAPQPAAGARRRAARARARTAIMAGPAARKPPSATFTATPEPGASDDGAVQRLGALLHDESPVRLHHGRVVAIPAAHQVGLRAHRLDRATVHVGREVRRRDGSASARTSWRSPAAARPCTGSPQPSTPTIGVLPVSSPTAREHPPLHADGPATGTSPAPIPPGRTRGASPRACPSSCGTRGLRRTDPPSRCVGRAAAPGGVRSASEPSRRAAGADRTARSGPARRCARRT